MGESCFVFPSLFKVRHPCVPICDLCLNIVVPSSLLSSCILVRYADIRMYRNSPVKVEAGYVYMFGLRFLIAF